LCVVFDTNAYQGIGSVAFAEMRNLEKANSIVGLASYWTCIELISKTAMGSGDRYSQGSASLKRLWEHCKIYEPGHEYIRILGDSEAQVPLTLFGLRPQGREQYYGYVGSWIGRFTAAGFTGWSEGQAIAQAAQRDLDAEQIRFADALFSAVVRTVNPNAVSWGDAIKDTAIRNAVLAEAKSAKSYGTIAGIIVEKAAAEVKVTLTPQLMAEKTAQVVEVFHTPLRIYNQVVIDMLQRGLDMSKPKRSNTIWDYQISFSVGSCANFEGVPAWLITSDNAILKAAALVPSIPNILSMSGYLELLRSGSKRVDEAIAASVAAC
jgi:hypothetical protein